jgi:PAS domain S-box-containing protein
MPQRGSARSRTSGPRVPPGATDVLARALWESTIGVGIVGGDLRYRSVNPALARLNGTPAADHVGHTAAEVLPDAPQVEAAHAAVIATGRAVDAIAVRLATVSDAGEPEERRSVRWFMPLRGADGEPAGLLCVAVPSPDENALAADLVESSPEGIALVDASRRYLLANPAIAAINGPSQGAHLGRRVRDVIPEVARWAEQILDAVLETGRAVRGVSISAERPQGSGRMRHWLCSFFPVRRAGRVDGVGAVLTEVTELREREAALESTRTALEAETARARGELEQLDDVVHALSHDLRTPLAAMLGSAELVERHADRPDVVRRMAGALLRSGRRLDAMVADLAEMVRLEAGRAPVRAEPVPVAPFLHDLLERLRAALDVGAVQVEIEPLLPNVLAEPARLERLLVNLVSNALKHGEGAPVVVSARAAAGLVELAVADRGPGIPADEQGRIFERFYRGRAAGAPGLGLGLYLARLLAESQGGTIAVESAPGEGTTFRVRLRAARP